VIGSHYYPYILGNYSTSTYRCFRKTTKSDI